MEISFFSDSQDSGAIGQATESSAGTGSPTPGKGSQAEGTRPSLEFIVYDSSGVPNQARRDVRAFAARKCAAKRRATMARKAEERQAQGQQRKRKGAGTRILGRSTSPSASVQGALSGTDEPSSIAASKCSASAHGSASGLASGSVSHGQSPPIRHTPIARIYPTPATSPDGGQQGSQFLEVLASSLSSGGQARLPATVWQTFVECGPLFQCLLLLAATHRQPIPQSIQLWLRQDAMRAIIAYVQRMDLQDRNAVDKALAAIALLANWEHCFGEPDAGEMHRRGLRDILDRQQMAGISPTAASGVRERLARLTDDVTQNGAALALQTFKDYFSILNNTLDTVTTPLTSLSPCPPGFAELRTGRLIEDRLLLAVVQISFWHVSLPDAGQRLRKIIIQLTSSHAGEGSTMEYQQAHLLARLAALELSVGVLMESTAPQLDLDFVLDTREGSRASAVESAGLRPELLVDTAYAELALWATAVICAVTGTCHLHHIMALCALLHKLNIRRWVDFEEALASFSYPKSMIESRCKEVWETVRQYDDTLGMSFE